MQGTSAELLLDVLDGILDGHMPDEEEVLLLREAILTGGTSGAIFDIDKWSEYAATLQVRSLVLL